MCDDMTNALALSEKKNPLANEVAKNIFSKNKIPTNGKSAWFISNHKTSWFYFSPKLNFTRVNTADPVHFTLTPPECHMEIRNGYGTTGARVAGPVHVGDPLTLMILMRSAWGKFCLIFFSLRSLIYVFDSLHILVTSFLFFFVILFVWFYLH